MRNAQHRVALESACRGLLQQYLRAIDTHSWESLHQVFTADAVFARNGAAPLRGVAEITGFFTRLEDGRHARGERHRTQHHLTTVWVNVDDTTRIVATSYVLVMRQVLEEDTSDPVFRMRPPELLLQYEDEVRLEGTQWRLCRHEARHLFRAAGAVAPR